MLPVGGLPFACLRLGLLAVLSTFQHQRVTFLAGSGLHSLCWEALRRSSTMVVLVNFPFLKRELNQMEFDVLPYSLLQKKGSFKCTWGGEDKNLWKIQPCSSLMAMVLSVELEQS